MDAWIIYGLVASLDLRIRYVGYSKSPHVRLLQHLSKARNGDGRRVYDWIRSKEADGQSIKMLVLQTGSSEGWKIAEKQWIAALRGTLLNLSEGGGVPSIPAASRKSAGQKLKSRVFSEQHRARISEANRGRKRPDVVARNAATKGYLSGPMNLSETERARRSLVAKTALAEAARQARLNRTEADRKEIAQRARDQMKRVWGERLASR